jgi:hypothetical protein
MGAHLKALNRKQEKRRIALGRPGEIKDTSIMSLEEGRAYKEELRQALLAEGKDVADLNADSFDDLTDKENPDFFYVSRGVWAGVDVVLTLSEPYRLSEGYRKGLVETQNVRLRLLQLVRLELGW